MTKDLIDGLSRASSWSQDVTDLAQNGDFRGRVAKPTKDAVRGITLQPTGLEAEDRWDGSW